MKHADWGRRAKTTADPRRRPLPGVKFKSLRRQAHCHRPEKLHFPERAEVVLTRHACVHRHQDGGTRTDCLCKPRGRTPPWPTQGLLFWCSQAGCVLPSTSEKE